MEQKIKMINAVNLSRAGYTSEAEKEDPRPGRFRFSVTNKWIERGFNQSSAVLDIVCNTIPVSIHLEDDYQSKEFATSVHFNN